MYSSYTSKELEKKLDSAIKDYQRAKDNGRFSKTGSGGDDYDRKVSDLESREEIRKLEKQYIESMIRNGTYR